MKLFEVISKTKYLAGLKKSKNLHGKKSKKPEEGPKIGIEVQ